MLERYKEYISIKNLMKVGEGLSPMIQRIAPPIGDPSPYTYAFFLYIHRRDIQLPAFTGINRPPRPSTITRTDGDKKLLCSKFITSFLGITRKNALDMTT